MRREVTDESQAETESVGNCQDKKTNQKKRNTRHIYLLYAFKTFTDTVRCAVLWEYVPPSNSHHRKLNLEGWQK